VLDREFSTATWLPGIDDFLQERKRGTIRDEKREQMVLLLGFLPRFTFMIIVV